MFYFFLFIGYLVLEIIMKMNLNVYDNVNEKLDKTKTWVDIKKKTLLSREIKYRKYLSILKRYDPDYKVNIYFLALLNDVPEHKNYTLTKLDSYGRVKIKLGQIWNETSLSQLDTDCNIVIKLVESDDTGEIYILDA